MENQLAVQDDLIFDPKNLTNDTIKKYLCSTASEQELTMGLQIAKSFNLNPLKREVYFVKYKADQPMQVLVGYEVYLKRAERSSKWDGMEATTEGKVEDGSLKAVVKIFRKDWTRPLIHEAFYSEYVQKKYDGTVNTFWKNKPTTMIKKVAISQAFRLAFPDEFDGMPYTSDEVIDTEKIVDVKIEEPLSMPKPIETPVIKPTIVVETLKADKPVEVKVEPKNEVQAILESSGGKVVKEEVEYINTSTQSAIKALANKKGFDGKGFKDFLMFNFEFESLAKIPVKGLDYVTKKLESLPDKVA